MGAERRQPDGGRGSRTRSRQYPVGVAPDRNWRGAAFDFGEHYSPDGAIEYKSSTFGGALQGKLLVARYSAGDDIIVLTPGGDQPRHSARRRASPA